MVRRTRLPEKVRVSVGSAIVLGLIRGILDAKPTTIYLLTYRNGRCTANCGFCPQARASRGRADMLSRVVWPAFPTKQVLLKIGNATKVETIKRVCVQALNYPTVFDDILGLVYGIRSYSNMPISVSCQPLNQEQMKRLAKMGVERVSIALDAATKEVFDRIKGPLANGPYTWENQLKALKEAVQVFGKGFVSTHLIVGLGESEKDLVRTMQWCIDIGVYPSLFAFTPIPGTALESHPPPTIDRYRRIQIAHYLMTHGETRYENMKFDEDGRILHFGVSKDRVWQVVETGMPFVTSGCPGCNRPYYNERPGGLIYNYPRRPLPEELVEIRKQIKV